MRKINVIFLWFFLVALAAPSQAFRVASSGEVDGLPYVIYNSTYGLYYGVIGKGRNIFNKEESLTLSAYLISNGGNGAYFVFSLPDDDYRHGKMFPLGFDLTGAVGRTISERYYGLGSNTPRKDYTTFNNAHDKFIFQFIRPFNDQLLGEVDFFTAANVYSDIVQGVNPLTPAIQDAAKNYAGANLKLTVDTRDQSLDPHAGVYIIGNADFGLRNCSYVKGGVDLRSYHTPFSPDQILAARLVLSQALGNTVPLYELPALGGKDTLRGYTVSRWRDKASALVNLEYRFPLFVKWFQPAVFLEAGKVGEELSQIGFYDWAADAGLGIHLILGGNVIVRGDFGVGAEGMNMNFFYNQAF